MSNDPKNITANVSISRRRLLQAAGAGTGLVLAWSSIASRAGAQSESQAAAAGTQREPPTTVDSYLTVHEDGSVTLATGKVEFGQGIQTGFGQIVAEELDLSFDKVSVLMGITDQVPYDGATVGSGSTRRSGIFIRQAAAEMHQWLLELGAQKLSVGVDAVSTHDGAVIVTDDSTKSVTYAELAVGVPTNREWSDQTVLKDPGTYSVVGQSIPRVDVPFKVNGEMKYGYDATVEGMVHGKVVRAPALGATLLDIDFSAAAGMPGVIGTFRDADFAGLAAERRDQAESALAQVKATWSEVTTGNTSENIYDLITSTADAGTVMDKEPGDPDTAIAGAATKLSATFRAPYVSHSPLEPKASLVQILPDRVNVWTSTQAPFAVQESVAALLGRPLEQVVVTGLMSGGAFGSKSSAVAELEAAKLAQAFGRPVRVQWTRPEEFQFGRFRPAEEAQLSAGLDASGKLVGWKYDLYASTYHPEGAAKPTPCAANSGANAADVYGLPQTKTTFYQGHSPLPPHFWRGNGTAFNGFAYDSMMDELAEAAGQDPVTFRSGLLGENPRMQAVMDAVVSKAQWTPGVGSTGQGYGLCLAFADQTYIAELAQVAVDVETGQIRVLHVDVAADCGLVINPDAATRQLQGAVIYALSPTIREMTTFDNGKVTNASWAQYQPITMAEVPTIDVIYVEDKSQPMGGIGEPACAAISGAVANAVYDAVGVRLRELPFTPDRVLAAIKEQLGTPGATPGATPAGTPAATPGATPIAAD